MLTEKYINNEVSYGDPKAGEALRKWVARKVKAQAKKAAKAAQVRGQKS